jgi:hypothetical protein
MMISLQDYANLVKLGQTALRSLTKEIVQRKN